MEHPDKITIPLIHQTFVPEHDKFHGRILPRIKCWLAHIGEVAYLWGMGNKPYTKNGRTNYTCREHAAVEYGDLLYFTADIVWMITGIELPIVPESTLQRIWQKMAE
ncbi:MAG: hypothetical protein ABIH39_03835 [Candidatus Margulisiibacteriota bacterium]